MKTKKMWLFFALILAVVLGIAVPAMAASTVTESDWIAAPSNPLVKCEGGSCDHTKCDYVYSFAVIGDTQNLNYKDAQNYAAALKNDPSLTYADFTQANMRTLYNWILNKQNELNIQYVMGVGDITQSFNTSQTYYNHEWPLAKEAISLLDGKIGYSLVRGNHDISSGLNTQFGVGTAYYNALVALSETNDAEGRPMGGFRLADKIEDSYRKIVAGGNKYIIFALEYYPTEETLVWMNELLTLNPDYTALVTLHNFIGRDNTFVDDHETTTPAEDAEKENWKQTATGGQVPPRRLWEEVLSKHANVQMVICGHVDEDDVHISSMQGDNGNTVTFMLTDTQTIDSTTPVGVVTMLYFSADGKVAHVEHISTVRDAAGKPAYLRDVNQFTLDLDYSENGENGWTETKYGAVPTKEYEANTFHILLDDDGIPENDSFYYGSYNSWEDVVKAIYPWTGLGSAENRSLKQYNILMSKDYTNSTSSPNTLTNNTRSTITLDLNGNTLTNSAYLYRVYNKFDTYPPTIELKNGNVIQKGSSGIVVLQSGKLDNCKLTVNLENLNISYNGGTACVVGYYDGNAPYNSVIDLNVTNCNIDTTGAGGAVTLFKLADGYDNCDVTMTVSGVTVKGTTAANTVVFTKNSDTVKALPDASGNALTVSLTENVSLTDIYEGVNGGQYIFGAPVENAGRYTYTLAKSNYEETPYGRIDTATYPASTYPFVLFNSNGFVKAYKTYNAFLKDIASVSTASTLLLRSDWNTTSDGANSNALGDLKAPLTIDLNKFTITRGSYHLFQMVGKGKDISLTVKNGTIASGSKLPPIVFNNSGSSTYREHITVTFENVTFAPSTATQKSLLIASYGDGTDAGTIADVIFNNCTFDLTKATATGNLIFNLMDNKSANKNDITVTINGGQVKATTFNQVFADYNAARDDNASPDTIRFGECNGTYPKFVATSASEAPAIDPVNVEGKKMEFSNVGTADAPDYRLNVIVCEHKYDNIFDGTCNSCGEERIPAVSTVYGTIPAEWTDVNEYPFVIFAKGNNTAIAATASWREAMTTAVANDGSVILMRRDFDCAISGDRFYLNDANASITLDLDDHVLSNSEYALAYYGNTAANTTFTITVKNGTYKQASNRPFINVDYSAAAQYKTINIFFEDVIIQPRHTAVSWAVIANYSNGKPKFNGKVAVGLTDCTIDFTGSKYDTILIHAGTEPLDDDAAFDISINGCKIIADDIANYKLFGIGEGDTVTFGKGSDGNLIKLVTEKEPALILETNVNGDTYEFKATEVAGEYVLTRICTHSYDNDFDPDCNECGEVRSVTHVSGYSLSLEGDIGVNTYVILSDKLDPNNILVKFTVDGVTTEQKLGEYNAERGYKFTCKVNATQMTSEIKFELYDGETLILTDTYSVAKYAKEILTNDAYKAAQPVVKAMLNYGGLSQEYFGIEAENPAADYKYTDELASVTKDLIAEKSVNKKNGSVEGLAYAGSWVELRSTLVLYHAFTVNGDIAEYTFTFGDETLEPIYMGGNTYAVAVTEIYAQDMATEYAVTVNGTYTLTYNALNYLKLAYSDASLTELVSALYLYYAQAYDYFN